MWRWSPSGLALFLVPAAAMSWGALLRNQRLIDGGGGWGAFLAGQELDMRDVAIFDGART